jgi:hypothetical protein
MSANKNFSRRHGGTEISFAEWVFLICGTIGWVSCGIWLAEKFSVPPCLCENPPAVEATP